MKRFCLIVMAVGCSLLARAQTNATGTLPTARGPTLISSASADFDLAGHEAIYHGHVRVDDPQMKLACEQLIADVPQAGGHVNHIVAETNVVIDFQDTQGHTRHATCDKAVYVYSEEGGTTNETITLTGTPPNPQMEDDAGNTITGDVIVYDRLNNRSSVSNMKMIFRHGFIGAAATNAPETNKTNPLPAKTNSPPAAVENADPLTK